MKENGRYICIKVLKYQQRSLSSFFFWSIFFFLEHIEWQKETDSSTFHSGVTGGREQSAPWHFSPGNFCWSTGKKGARKKGKMEMKRRENLKGKRWKIENGREKGYENEQRTIYFLSFFSFLSFFFLFFFFFFFACHFLKPLKFVWGSPKMDNF